MWSPYRSLIIYTKYTHVSECEKQYKTDDPSLGPCITALSWLWETVGYKELTLCQIGKLLFEQGIILFH